MADNFNAAIRASVPLLKEKADLKSDFDVPIFSFPWDCCIPFLTHPMAECTTQTFYRRNSCYSSSCV